MTSPETHDHPHEDSDAASSISAIGVAVDVGPLYGHRTGVGIACQGMLDTLDADERFRPSPYLVSARATPRAGHRKLPIPGIAASHVWSRGDHPLADRWLGDADVVHGTNYVVPPSRKPTVVSVYDCWFLGHPEQATALVRRAGRALRRAAERGAWIHTAADAIARQATDLLGTDRVVTVRLGAPPAPPPLGALRRPPVADTLAGRPFVLAIGTEERRKDLGLLVDAFAQSEVEDHLLVLAGARGDLSAELDDRIERLDPARRDRVLRLGPVDDDTKHWLLRQAATLAYPSLDEGFGFPVLEAQLAGTPVVARAVGSLPEVAGDGASLVGARDSADFAEALDAALTDGASRLGLIEAGHRNVNRFSWSDTADGLHRLYRRAIGAHS